MLQPEKIFENFFEDKNITPLRLYDFAMDTIGKLQAANANGQFTTFISGLSTAANTLGTEVGETKSALAVQKGTTMNVNEVIKNFKTYMSENEGVIAKALGGFKSGAYQAFYPQGVSEYSKATKTQLPALLIQVSDAATLYATQLGTSLSNELKAFNSEYNNARNAQLLQKGTVVDNRTERSANRKILEIELLKTIHSIAVLYPANVEKCLSLFNFSLLESSKKIKKNIPPLDS